MISFNFEKNLSHQTDAVESTISIFENIDIIQPSEIEKKYINPHFNVKDVKYFRNVSDIQKRNEIKEHFKNSNIIDIMMETGTGKTYTYAKTIFELNKNYGIFKFVIVVPTLSIKAGTIDFLKSESSRVHFKEQYEKILQLHIVESQKGNKNKKSYIPQAVTEFVRAGNYDTNSIQVLIINAGMINSDTMQKSFDKLLFDKYDVPFEAIAFTKPFVIIDEPHKFGKTNKSWDNIQKMKPQFILRYGATFPEYENLIYTLTAVDSFNRNLVKGVIGHITEFDGKNAIVKFINSDGNEASFELIENGSNKTIKVAKKDSLEKIHHEMTDLYIENLNQSTVVLSNGLELKKGDKVNPYSYSQTLQEILIEKAIKNHFEIEEQLLTRDVKIKPLTLFFIDNIDEYRNKDGYIRKTIETYVKAEVKRLLQEIEKGTKNSKIKDGNYYKNYLEKTLLDVSQTHAGYFSKDNTEKDEAIEKEINEILHDKQAILDLENPRRFIFSKWTLREGWDNPNVFQICKLRSSGSEISKLQEVGRGLRLPVNEYGNREKDEQFYLNYFVDFTESDFVEKLVKEINEKSGAISIEDKPEKLTDEIIQKIVEKYNKTEEDLLDYLDKNNVITRSNSFKSSGFDFIKKEYPLIFEGINSNKVRKYGESQKRITIRTEKYSILKELWEEINKKVILEYKFENEEEFKKLFTSFLIKMNNNFTSSGFSELIKRIEIIGNEAIVREEEVPLTSRTTINTMKYSNFLMELSKRLNINIKTIHKSIIDSKTEINKYLNTTTIRTIEQGFNYYLMANAIAEFSVEYQNISNKIHPTKFTDENGNVEKEIVASDIGSMFSSEKVDESYFLNELYFDSALEKTNIQTNIKDVQVFTKIPKNSIKIPIAGGATYSPDFAYVVNYENGSKSLHLIVETKNVESDESLRNEEKYKIKHAELFFKGKVKIEFRKQLSNKKISELISEIISSTK